MNGLSVRVLSGACQWGRYLWEHRILCFVIPLAGLTPTKALALVQLPQACCLSDGQCVDVTVADCAAQLGLPLGPGTSCAQNQWACRPLKWAQPPVPAVMSNHFHGWNQYSVWDLEGQGPSVIVADDWVCATEEPVTDIHWWGSYVDWRETIPPDGAVQPPVDHFHILFWTDVPAGVGGPFSHPGTVVWEVIRPRLEANEQFVGWDYNPATSTYDAAFHYDLDLRLPEWFYQNPGPGQQVYWVTIAACYEPNPIFPMPHPWGWKTRPRDPGSPAPDAAVTIFDPWWAVQGSVYQSGEPICWPGPSPCGPTDQWDMAFELTTKSQVSVFKWEQGPDLAPTGMDVNATAPFIAADDFLCTTTGPLSQISIVGSWYHDILPNGDPRNVTFTLSLHADIPATMNPYGPWSMPGGLLWSRVFSPGDFFVQPLATGLQEGWMEPPNWYEPFGDTVAYTYVFNLLPNEVMQTGTPQSPVIYWLDVQAAPAPGPVPVYFGWKTSSMHWNDDATWNLGAEPPPPPWSELRYPPPHPMAGQSIDLAFMIIGTGFGDETLKWSQPPEPGVECFRGWDEYSVYGSPQWIVADDWPCETDRPITDIHWWGSYVRWGEPVPPPVAPDMFHIAIWTDVSPPTSGNCCHCWDDPPGVRNDCSEGPFTFEQCMDMGAGYSHCEFHPNARCVGAPDWMCEPRETFSHPGQVLTEFAVPRAALSERVVGCDALDPLSAPDTCFKYDYSPDVILFAQPDPACSIYWVSIAAMYIDGPGVVDHPWGWKTREHLFADDAVRVMDPTAPLGGMHYVLGEPIIGPDGLTWDMAFALTSAELLEACCRGPAPNFICQDLTPAQCAAQGGVRQGPGTMCGAVEACCLPDGSCVMTDPLCCDEAGGTALGAGTVCGGHADACCVQGGACVDADPMCCPLLGGVAQGPFTQCTNIEACCLLDGTCQDVDPQCCDELGGTAQGAGTACVDMLVGCCLPDGTCVNTDPLCCDEKGGTPAPGGITCLTDQNGNGIDDACEGPPTQACCLPDARCVEVDHRQCVQLGGDPQGPNTICDLRVCPALKWSQPPTFGPFDPSPPCFWGWDEPSHYQCCQIVADDWLCQTDQPVTDIHWWGSYELWEFPEPPADAPMAFHVGVWTDVPRGADPEHPFSHPGTMVHQWIVPRMSPTLTEKWVGCDEYPDHPRESCFRYDFTIPENEWFYQAPLTDPTVYWISISAVYMGPPTLHSWGWKTREHFFNDDAVRIELPNAPMPGMSFLEGEPIEEPQGTSWDMAFVLTTRAPSRHKWDQWPSTLLPGLHAHDDVTLADQWECSGGNVTGLHWWGNYELDPFGQERRGAGIDVFRVSIHANNPTLPWCLPQDPEMWGFSLFFDAANETDTGLVNSEGGKIYRYEFNWWPGFEQQAGNVYWLDLEARSEVSADPALWRWQESARTQLPRLCPAAERTLLMAWHSIVWPIMPPIYTDLAFQVVSAPAGPPDPDPVNPDKNRYISMVPGNAGSQTALRVKLVSLDRFHAWDGEWRWVGPSGSYREDSPTSPLFSASFLECDPHFQDWGGVGLLHVTGAEIVPLSVYAVQAVALDCPDLTNEECYSAPLMIGTQEWGDVVAAFGGPSQPNFADISAVVAKFRALPGSPIKARAQLQPNVPDPSVAVNFADISRAVAGFQGFPYNFSGPCVCPSTATCPTLDACKRCTP